MKDLCKDVNFDCSERGIQVQSMDSSHVALVSLLLRESAFQEFKCDRGVSLGMNVDSLQKVLRMCGASDSLKLRADTGADHVSFQCESSAEDRIADFDLKVCRDLKEFGETMQINASKEGIRFSVQGDLGSGNVVLKPREAEKPEERVSLTVHEAV